MSGKGVFIMAVMDEFKEERERMKQESFRKRLEYFWDYHKFHVLIGLLVFCAAFSFIHDLVTKKETAFMAALIDCSSIESSAQTYREKLGELMGIDTDNAKLVLDASFHMSNTNVAETNAAEVLMARIAATELDTMLAGQTQFERYTMSGAFLDIREVLTKEQIAYYEDSFYYADRAAIENSSISASAEGASADPTDHTSPEGMEDPIPVGIYIEPTEEFNSIYYFSSDEPVIFGVIANAPHTELAGQFLDHITGRIE